MEIKVIENKKNTMIVEIDESPAFCNALKKELYADKHVKAASFNVEHPLVSKPKVIVETDGKEAPSDALKKAASRLKKQSKEMKAAFNKEVK